MKRRASLGKKPLNFRCMVAQQLFRGSLVSDVSVSLGIDMGPDDLCLVSKMDEGGLDGISGKTGAGVPEMLEHVQGVLGQRVLAVGSAINQRHIMAITAAISSVEMAMGYVELGEEALELPSEELRVAVASLESLVGRVDVEHILDAIFSQFCIGK